jgi:hypothetical protein
MGVDKDPVLSVGRETVWKTEEIGRWGGENIR